MYLCHNKAKCSINSQVTEFAVDSTTNILALMKTLAMVMAAAVEVVTEDDAAVEGTDIARNHDVVLTFGIVPMAVSSIPSCVTVGHPTTSVVVNQWSEQTEMAVLNCILF